MVTTTWPTVIAAALPIIGIAFSSWSFSFGEEGATPNQPADPYVDFDRAGEIIDLGMRRSARLYARLTFRVGGLCLAAAVPMGIADSHAEGLTSLPAIAAYVILGFACFYAVRELRA